jgi:hypothetical protein
MTGMETASQGHQDWCSIGGAYASTRRPAKPRGCPLACVLNKALGRQVAEAGPSYRPTLGYFRS